MATIVRGIAATLAALLVVQASGLAPVVGADHVYSHRYYVVGRVVDEMGTPVEGIEVEASFEGIGGSDAGECPVAQPPGSQPVTGADGRYLICRHVHSLADSGAVTVSAGDTSVVRNLDSDFRRSVVHLEVDEPRASQGDANVTEEDLDVVGIVWRPTDMTREEGVPVDGRALSDVNVTVTLRVGEDVSYEAVDETDPYGTYEVTFGDIGPSLSDAWVEVEALDPRTGDVEEYVFPVSEEERRYRFIFTPAVLEAQPKQFAFLWGSLAVLGLIAAGVYALHLVSRRGALPDESVSRGL